ncbi:MAG: hypothetical protein JWP78_70 [Mucilaginibacter sp.]|nr:hypothetical protein [Mucilaginibacter sp.]
MRSIKIFIVIACFSVAGVLTPAFINVRHLKTVSADAPVNKGFAVIELFTSEGCSSCPPADALVARIQKESSNKPVYILAFHVDYWNRLGWKDVFSSSEYSARQNQYARWLKLSSVYTPQLVVNGLTEFVGSEEGNLRDAIRTSLQKPAKAELTLSGIKVESDRARAHYHIEGATTNAVLLVALIEKNATTKVRRGENGGRTLSHVQIVNQLKSLPLKNDNEDTGNIALPHGFDPQKYELIGLVQNTASGEIIGAAKAEFPPTGGLMQRNDQFFK